MMVEIPSIQILRLADVVRYVGLSKATVWRHVQQGRFPAPIKLTERAVGWRVIDVQEWIDSRPTKTGANACEAK